MAISITMAGRISPPFGEESRLMWGDRLMLLEVPISIGVCGTTPWKPSQETVENAAACVIECTAVADQELDAATVNDEQCGRCQTLDVFF